MNEYTGYFIFALLCGLVCSLFAKEKGKNTIAWFIIGFAFSFVGILIISLIKKKIDKKKNGQH